MVNLRIKIKEPWFRKYQLEIQKLKQELDERSQMPIDSMVAELEKERQKALEDKQEVMSAYEQRNRDLVQEREMRKQLEEKISALNSQMLVGGQKIEETPQFQNALEKQQKLIRQQYQERLQELEKERQNIEEDKAQTDKYKQLLLKQRDIMIALTNRLNERDETILQLQEELDAYDKLQKELEDINQTKESRIQQLVELLKQKEVEIPMNLDLPANSNNNNAKQQLLLAEMPSSKMILVADPSSNSYIQTLPQQGSYHHSSEAVTQYELKNQIDINKKLELDLKISRMEQERQKKDLVSLQEQIQKYENDTTTEQAKKSVDLILNQLTKPANGNSLATVAQELQKLQKILSEKEASPKKTLLKIQQETSNLKQQEIINKLMIKPSKSNNQLNPPPYKKQKQKSVEDLWN
ncbi:unnamed protein product (macronuclear) [Paramecium tetraurelia]|uniref:Uncharacterized protein n=1 Tax=Paramecium tetraurelia TaxID=5888 RepID=A0D978_PARTE|nr:uncharacterized protein GSPATT00039336001 [Paramecium tetraurelia]CAK79595.1 unnamed protein product [Paramecium tetraurelia]|eukprot:XP_001446992.1 hypothetical protein (macronuclear) [Paramecium tetraurelia strain d4-2]